MKRFWILFVLVSVLLIDSFNSIYAYSQKPAAESPQMIQDIKSEQGISSLSGKVVESMDSGDYTYVSVEKAGRKTWVAVPRTKVEVGQNISFQPGMVMRNFKSKTLNRSFESIVFSGGIIEDNAQKADPPIAGHTPPKIQADKTVKVDKASGPDGYTVAELYEKRSALDKENVVVRGKVVKFSSAIMGKNWIHVQDGSGDPLKGTNDILVTSHETVAIGDIITAKGTLFKNKDFGSGYTYSVIIEEASIKK